MTIARAAVGREVKEQSNPDPAGDANWHARQKEKIAAAEALRDSAPADGKPALTRRIAALNSRWPAAGRWKRMRWKGDKLDHLFKSLPPIQTG